MVKLLPFFTADNTDHSRNLFNSVPEKTLHRSDRLGRTGCGLTIAVNASWSSARLNFGSYSTNNEKMGIRFFQGSYFINIVNIYFSSGLVVPDLINISHDLSGPSLILGDFNLCHQLWGSPVASWVSENFVEWLLGSPVCLINFSVSTHVALSGIWSMIDFFLCSSDLFVSMSFQVEHDN